MNCLDQVRLLCRPIENILRFFLKLLSKPKVKKNKAYQPKKKQNSASEALYWIYFCREVEDRKSVPLLADITYFKPTLVKTSTTNSKFMQCKICLSYYPDTTVSKCLLVMQFSVLSVMSCESNPVWGFTF